MGGGGRELPYKWDGGVRRNFSGVKKSIFGVQPRKVDNGSLFGDVCQSMQLYKEDIQSNCLYR